MNSAVVTWSFFKYRDEIVEKASKEIFLGDAKKSGFVIRSTIEDLLLANGEATPQIGLRNAKWTFSTDSTLIK
jgi:hypothetical protein